jgi:hypothetical protein
MSRVPDWRKDAWQKLGGAPEPRTGAGTESFWEGIKPTPELEKNVVDRGWSTDEAMARIGNQRAELAWRRIIDGAPVDKFCDGCLTASEELQENLRTKEWLKPLTERDVSDCENRRMDNEAVAQVTKRALLMTANRTPAHPDCERCRRRDIALKGRWSRFPERVYQRSPDKAASLERKHLFGGMRVLPDHIGRKCTEGVRAVAAVIGLEWKRCGSVSMYVDTIVAKAGLSRSMWHVASRALQKMGMIEVIEDRDDKRPNGKNTVRILSEQWRKWINRCVKPQPNIGCKQPSPSISVELSTIGKSLKKLEEAIQGNPETFGHRMINKLIEDLNKPAAAPSPVPRPP